MKKLTSTLITLALGLGLVMSQSPAEARQANTVCRVKQGVVEMPFEDGVTRGVIHYKACSPTKGRAWVLPLNGSGIYNMDGSHMNCDPFFRKFDGVSFNFYMWDPSGRNFNPAKFFVPCDESTTNSEVQKYKDAPRLYFGRGHGPDMQPRWKVNVTVHYNFNKDVQLSKWKRFKLL